MENHVSSWWTFDVGLYLIFHILNASTKTRLSWSLLQWDFSVMFSEVWVKKAQTAFFQYYYLLTSGGIVSWQYD